MARGGKRTPGEGKTIGRPKRERPTNGNVAAKVLAEAKAQQLWLDMIDLERRRLFSGSSDRFSIIPLTNLLRYLEDRAYGRPVDTVNHLHDKPLEMNVNVNLGQRLAAARKRALGS